MEISLSKKRVQLENMLVGPIETKRCRFGEKKILSPDRQDRGIRFDFLPLDVKACFLMEKVLTLFRIMKNKSRAKYYTQIFNFDLYSCLFSQYLESVIYITILPVVLGRVKTKSRCVEKSRLAI